MSKPFNLESWLISQLRLLTRKYPPANYADKQVKEYYTVKSLKGKDLIRVKWTCAVCGKKDLKSTEVERDHKIPVVGPEGKPTNPDGSMNWNIYLPRMFCHWTNFQKLCISCHEAKTFQEQGVRRRRKKNKANV